MQLIFEKSAPGRGISVLGECDVPRYDFGAAAQRGAAPALPEVSEGDLCRHYTALEGRAFGVNKGFYPLGSCTMKHNPRINEETAALPGFADAHPLAEAEDVQGCLEAMHLAQELLCEVTGMDAVSLSPAAGAHGEFAGLLTIRRYHEARGDLGRTKVIAPDSAHGTNPASAAMAGFGVVSIPSGPDGCVDLAALRSAVGPDTAALMLTNPNTLGIFEKDIKEIAAIVHGAGGLLYYDGANLNAVMGVARPGDMDFDCIHLNLHKTFSTPHGGGGPGSGPVGCKAFLAQYMPGERVVFENGSYRAAEGNGRIKSFHGNFLVAVKALTYMLTLGREGMREAAKTAVLNANYLKKKLGQWFEASHPGLCMHEFVLGLEKFKAETGVSAGDVAKALIDRGMHPPTIYFPLIVHEALMLEPTETESIETLDAAAAAFGEIFALAKTDPDALHAAPLTTPVGRPDEAAAARNPVLRWMPLAAAMKNDE